MFRIFARKARRVVRPKIHKDHRGSRLYSLGVASRDMLDVLKSIKAVGALHAEFVVR
jgi:hypothetical protein